MAGKSCGLICVIPPELQVEWAGRLPESVKRFRPAALILRGPYSAGAKDIIAAAKPFDLAILLENDIEAALQTAATGLFFSAPGGDDVAKARAHLGSAVVIGTACGLSRHAAMESAEAGADFIAFDARDSKNWDQAADLCSWWDETTVVPGALFCGSALPGGAILDKARADFVILEEAAKATESLTFAKELGLQSQT